MNRVISWSQLHELHKFEWTATQHIFHMLYLGSNKQEIQWIQIKTRMKITR